MLVPLLPHTPGTPFDTCGTKKTTLANTSGNGNFSQCDRMRVCVVLLPPVCTPSVHVCTCRVQSVFHQPEMTSLLHPCVCVYICVRLWRCACVEMCGDVHVWRCVEMCGDVWRWVEMCGDVWRCVEMCGDV